jgi:hypothetical protein
MFVCSLFEEEDFALFLDSSTFELSGVVGGNEALALLDLEDTLDESAKTCNGMAKKNCTNFDLFF